MQPDGRTPRRRARARRARTRCRSPSGSPHPRDGALASGVEREVDQRAGTTMPPSARDRGNAAARRSCSSPVRHLALDLEPDDEEEHGHQAVVHPVTEVVADHPVAEMDLCAACSRAVRTWIPRESSPRPGQATRRPGAGCRWRWTWRGTPAEAAGCVAGPDVPSETMWVGCRVGAYRGCRSRGNLARRPVFPAHHSVDGCILSARLRVQPSPPARVLGTPRTGV